MVMGFGQSTISCNLFLDLITDNSPGRNHFLLPDYELVLVLSGGGFVRLNEKQESLQTPACLPLRSRSGSGGARKEQVGSVGRPHSPLSALRGFLSGWWQLLQHTGLPGLCKETAEKGSFHSPLEGSVHPEKAAGDALTPLGARRHPPQGKAE